MKEKRIGETVEWESRPHRLTWIGSAIDVPGELVRQVSAVCFAGRQGIVLVSDGDGWGLPGGHPEPDETIDQTLVREVREEACAAVKGTEVLGAVLVNDLVRSDRYYQLRYFAIVDLLPFEAKHETSDRMLVAPSDFLRRLAWGRSPIAARLLEKALKSHENFLQPNARR